jgi:uncharacterized RDD family membrane protein YckC
MKCSKCGYLGFDTGDRCRNCGFQFSLVELYDEPDLALRSAGPDHPAFPASLAHPAYPSRGQDPALPLFVSPLDDDTPLITKPSAPRPPLAVRRSTPDAARIRAASASKVATAELALDLRPDPTPEPAPARTTPASAARPPNAPVLHQDAGIPRRLIAAVVDLLILGAVDMVVVYLTMQICGVRLNELALLPKGPLVAFLLVQNIGYLVAFTVGGQTLGKMMAGIKVIAGDCDVALDVPCALKRTMVSLMLAIPAGLGLLPALFDSQHRGLHDRFAGTRVVRATA